MKLTPFILLCSTGLFAIFSSTISKSPVLPLFASYLGADALGVGVVAAISTFAGIIASIPAGMLSDRFGRKRMLIVSAVIFSTAPFFYLMVNEIWHLAIVRFYHGFATAIFVPVSIASISDLFDKSRGEKIGWFSASNNLGRFMAPIVGGSIIGMLAFNPELGYRAVYLVCSAAGVITLILALRIPNPIITTPSLGKTEEWKETFKVVKSVIYKRAILITTIVEAAVFFAFGTFETFLPLYALKAGLSVYEVGIFLSLPVIALALTRPMMGRLSDKYGRKPQIFAGAILVALSMATLSFFTSFIALLALSILLGLSLSIVLSATSAFIADLSSEKARGSALGFLGTVMDIGHATGPVISGIVASYFSFKESFIFSSLILVFATVAFWIGVIRKSCA